MTLAHDEREWQIEIKQNEYEISSRHGDVVKKGTRYSGGN